MMQQEADINRQEKKELNKHAAVEGAKQNRRGDKKLEKQAAEEEAERKRQEEKKLNKQARGEEAERKRVVKRAEEKWRTDKQEAGATGNGRKTIAGRTEE